MATILVVDDRPENRRFLVTLLEYQQHRLLEAADGAEALDLVRAERPDLVISDILMPTMDGYEFVRQLRADPDIAATPVMFYTAHYRRHEAESLAESCGVRHVLTKPSEPTEILRSVAEVLEEKPADPGPLPSDFGRQHLQTVTDKLIVTTDALRTSNDRLSALVDINLQLASERNPRLLLDKVCRAARELIGAEYAVLAVGRPDAPAVEHYAATGMDPDTRGALDTPQLTRGVTGAAYTQREAQRVAPDELHGVDTGLPENHPAIESLLVAPIASLAQVHGWICLTNKVGAPEFTAEDERLLVILASQVGRIYENGSLYLQLQAQTRRLEEELAEVQRLNRVHAMLSGINTLIVKVRERKELLDEACRIAVDDGRFGVAWIGELDPGEHEVRPVAWAGIDAAELTRRLPVPSDVADAHSALVTAVRERRIVFDNDLLAHADAAGGHRRVAISRGFRSLVVLPLLVQGGVFGALVLYAREIDFFNDDELKLLKELAGDISFALEHIGKEEQLHFLAHFDPVTGLPNRILLHERLAQALHAAEAGGEHVAVMLCDVKRFHLVNETLGRQAGDALLRQIAQRFEAATPDPDCIARMTSNCFCRILPRAGDPSRLAHEIENSMSGVFAAPFAIDGKQLSLAANVGVALFPADGRDAEALLRNAEAALKRAKASGEPYLFYEPTMNAAVADILMLESRLRQAVESQQFVLHYQPKIDLARNTLCGMEALVRWQDPDKGLVPPMLFIPVLEQTGMILPVGRWVMQQALLDYDEWRAAGLNPPRIAVNVSAIQLRHKDFIDFVRAALATHADTAGALELEITESLLMEDIAANIAKLASLRDLGITVAIDDFGTGYSSLSYLARLPVNTLKIDRSFVNLMTSTPESAAIISTILSLARSLKLKVVAEGVETEEQSRLLKGLHCDEAQGYLYARAMPKERMEELLIERRRNRKPGD